MKYDIRMIATDMDGTLFTSRKEISPASVAAIKAAQEKGVLVTVCSGRFAQFASCKLREVGLSCPVISANGAVLWDDEKREVIAAYPMERSSAVQVNDVLHAYGVHYYAFAPQGIATSDAEQPHPAAAMQGGILIHEYGMHFSGGKEAIDHVVAGGQVVKYFVSKMDDERAARLDADLRKIPGIYVTSSGKNSLEVMHESVNKCFGAHKMGQMYGIEMKNMMTFGDYLNDIPMISAAGLGVAMGNALDEVKQCADYVTDTNDNDGVARAIEKFVL